MKQSKEINKPCSSAKKSNNYETEQRDQSTMQLCNEIKQLWSRAKKSINHESVQRNQTTMKQSKETNQPCSSAKKSNNYEAEQRNQSTMQQDCSILPESGDFVANWNFLSYARKMKFKKSMVLNKICLGMVRACPSIVRVLLLFAKGCWYTVISQRRFGHGQA